MKSTIRRIAAPLAVLAVISPLAACSSSGAAAGGKQTVVFQEQFSDTESAEMTKLVAQYEKAHPDITVKLVRDNDSSYYDKLVTQITAGKGPDIVRLEPPQVTKYITNGWLVPVNDVIGSKAQYFANTIHAASKGSTTYAVPQDVSTLALFYRKDLFAKAGISSPPATWSDLTTDAAKLTTGGKYGIGLFGGYGAYEFYPWLWQSGAEVVNTAGTKATFASADGVRALQLWVDLQKASMPSGMATATEDAVSGPFANGNIAMFTSGPYMVSALKSQGVTDAQLGVAALPKDQKAASVLGGMDIGVLKNSKVQGAAKAFLKWLMSDKTQTTWDKALGYVPAKKSLYTSPTFSSDPTVTQFGKIIESSLSRPTTAGASDVDTALGNALQSALSNKASAQQALVAAQAKADAALKSDG